MFVDDDYSCREIKNHLKRQLPQFKTAQNNADKAKDSFLFVLEGVTDFGVTKVVVNKVGVLIDYNLQNSSRSLKFALKMLKAQPGLFIVTFEAFSDLKFWI